MRKKQKESHLYTRVCGVGFSFLFYLYQTRVVRAIPNHSPLAYISLSLSLDFSLSSMYIDEGMTIYRNRFFSLRQSIRNNTRDDQQER